MLLLGLWHLIIKTNGKSRTFNNLHRGCVSKIQDEPFPHFCPKVPMDPSGHTGMRLLLQLVSLSIYLAKSCLYITVRLILERDLVDAIFDQDYHVIISFWRIHSDNISLWTWDSTSVKKVFVCCWAKRLFALDVVLGERAISYLQSDLVHLVSQLSCDFHLR